MSEEQALRVQIGAVIEITLLTLQTSSVVVPFASKGTFDAICKMLLEAEKAIRESSDQIFMNEIDRIIEKSKGDVK